MSLLARQRTVGQRTRIGEFAIHRPARNQRVPEDLLARDLRIGPVLAIEDDALERNIIARPAGGIAQPITPRSGSMKAGFGPLLVVKADAILGLPESPLASPLSITRKASWRLPARSSA